MTEAEKPSQLEEDVFWMLAAGLLRLTAVLSVYTLAAIYGLVASVAMLWGEEVTVVVFGAVLGTILLPAGLTVARITWLLPAYLRVSAAGGDPE